MKPIKVLHMYADILDLYGDSGNMEILSYRCQMRQIPFVCDHYRLNDPVPNFSDYDLIYLGGGADMEQRMLSSDLLRCKDGLKKAHADGVFFLMICGGYQLMGKFYRDADGNELPGLGLFNYYTIAPTVAESVALEISSSAHSLPANRWKLWDLKTMADRRMTYPAHLERSYMETAISSSVKKRATVKKQSLQPICMDHCSPRIQSYPTIF